MKSALDDLQKAIFTLLDGDATLGALINGVFDGAPQGQAFPYVTIGEATSVPFRTHNRKGEEVTETIHVWTRKETFKEALEILEELNRLLGDVDLTVTGFNVMHSLFEFSQTLRDDDEVRHVVAQYRIIIQEA